MFWVVFFSAYYYWSGGWSITDAYICAHLCLDMYTEKRQQVCLCYHAFKVNRIKQLNMLFIHFRQNLGNKY